MFSKTTAIESTLRLRKAHHLVGTAGALTTHYYVDLALDLFDLADEALNILHLGDV